MAQDGAKDQAKMKGGIGVKEVKLISGSPFVAKESEKGFKVDKY